MMTNTETHKDSEVRKPEEKIGTQPLFHKRGRENEHTIRDHWMPKRTATPTGGCRGEVEVANHMHPTHPTGDRGGGP